MIDASNVSWHAIAGKILYLYVEMYDNASDEPFSSEGLVDRLEKRATVLEAD